MGISGGNGCCWKIFPKYDKKALHKPRLCAKIFKHLNSAGILKGLPVGVEAQVTAQEADSPLPGSRHECLNIFFGGISNGRIEAYFPGVFEGRNPSV